MKRIEKKRWQEKIRSGTNFTSAPNTLTLRYGIRRNKTPKTISKRVYALHPDTNIPFPNVELGKLALVVAYFVSTLFIDKALGFEFLDVLTPQGFQASHNIRRVDHDPAWLNLINWKWVMRTQTVSSSTQGVAKRRQSRDFAVLVLIVNRSYHRLAYYGHSFFWLSLQRTRQNPLVLGAWIDFQRVT